MCCLGECLIGSIFKFQVRPGPRISGFDHYPSEFKMEPNRQSPSLKTYYNLLMLN
jgi:hypothetical protein